MANETYTLEIGAEVKKARKAVEDFAKDTKKQLSSISFSGNFTGLFAGLSLAKEAFSKVEDLIGSSIGAALEAEQAMTQLGNAMRLVGDYSTDALQSFGDLADEIEKTTKFSDDQVISASALAKAYGLTNAQTKDLIKAAADLSAVTGDDLNSSVEKLAKSYNGFLDKTLKQLTPELKNLTQEQLASGKAVEIVGGKFSGSAQEITKNFGGALIQLKNALGDTSKEIGFFVTQSNLMYESLNAVTITVRKFQTLFSAVGGNKKSEIELQIESLNNQIKNLESGGSIDIVQKLVSLLTGQKFNVDKEIDRIKEKINQIQDPEGDGLTANNRTRSYLKELEARKEAEISSNKKLESDRQSALEDFNKIRADVEKAGLSDIEKINKDAYEKIKIIQKAALTGAIKSQKEAQTLIAKVELDRAKKVSEEQLKITEKQLAAEKKLRDEAIARQKDIAANPLTAAIGGEIKTQQDVKAAAVGFATQVTKGAEGAKKLVVEGAALAGQAFLGIPKEVSGPLLDALSQGPEKVREMVREFVKSLPEVLKNVVLAIPVLIEELVKAVPQLISALIDAIPEVAQALAAEAPRIAAAIAAQGPQIGAAVITGIIENIPKMVDGFAKEFLKIPEKFLKELLGGLGGAGKSVTSAVSNGGNIISNAIGSIGDFLGFADGGRIADNPKLSNDKLVARLSAGEQVLGKDLSTALEAFLSGNNQQSQPTNISIQIGQTELAKVILDLNRAGYRLS